MDNPIGPVGTRTPHSPQPRTSRPRPYIPHPASPPDYGRFCEVHTRHRPLWRLTYAPDRRAPYRAHHRVLDGVTLAATGLDALDFALAQFPAPPRPRPYLAAADPTAAGDRSVPASTGAADDGPADNAAARVLDQVEAHCLHQLADDLAASTHEHTYWTSAVRDASLEILERIAALLGDTCGACCLRPAAHDGPHLDASGAAWDDSDNGEEAAR